MTFALMSGVSISVQLVTLLVAVLVTSHIHATAVAVVGIECRGGGMRACVRAHPPSRRGGWKADTGFSAHGGPRFSYCSFRNRPRLVWLWRVLCLSRAYRAHSRHLTSLLRCCHQYTEIIENSVSIFIVLLLHL